MTYSIVARCPLTGEMGVALQTHYFAAGTSAPWARAGVGAAVSQGWNLPEYGPKGLDLLETGFTPQQALSQLVADDAEAEVRQVAFVDRAGATAVHTGNGSIRYAGHVLLDGASVQSNMMLNDGVPEAMAESWRSTVGDALSMRLLATLVAAQSAGGDIRGQQSAALIVVSSDKPADWWEGTILDVRIDDHPNPLDELERHLLTHNAYRHLDEAFGHVANDKTVEAAKAYEAALAQLPDSPECNFWYAVLCAQTGELQKAKNHLQRASEHNSGWSELLSRLPDSKVMNIDRSVIDELLTT